MSFSDQLAQMMSGYDISEEEYGRIEAKAAAKELERRQEEQRKRNWDRQNELERERLAQDQEEIEAYGHILPEFVKGMPYPQYLDTRRWRVTAEYIKSRDGGRCRVCPSARKLNVHHRTYIHIYDEMMHDEDLVTLCELCHERHHAGVINIETLLALPEIQACLISKK